MGAVVVVHQIAKRLGITSALGNDRQGKLALWQVIARVIDQGSRLSAVRLATSHAACDILDCESFNENDLYKNLDWLHERQAIIEQRLFKSRYKEDKPGLFLYDVTSSYLEGQDNELAAFGYNRDKKSGKKQIVVGLLCDITGNPLSIEVFEGNTSDVKTMPSQIKKAAGRFGCSEVTFVGDRGMIKNTVIDELELVDGFHYITALTKPQMQTLLTDGIIQLSLFDKEIHEVEDTEKNVRYILRRNDVRAEEIRSSRRDKLHSAQIFCEKKNVYLATHAKSKTETALKAVQDKIAQLKIDRWVSVDVDQHLREIKIKQVVEQLAEEEKLDGCYVIKTDLEKSAVDDKTVHDRYKDLAKVEWAFRISKTAELELRPINVRKEERTRAHVFVVMMAYMIVRELARLWDSVDLTVQEALNELSTLCVMELNDGSVTKINTIPKPRSSVATLVDKAKVILPELLRARGEVVATRKKLHSERKRV
ncbi:MAG: IS1634 family transposase [Fibrobacter sp.]|nr:IS1634 family transposase [Fibrobacter sp.]